MAEGTEERQAALHFLRHELAARAVAEGWRRLRGGEGDRAGKSHRHAAHARRACAILRGDRTHGCRTWKRLRRRERGSGREYFLPPHLRSRRAMAVREMELLRWGHSHADDCGVAG